MALTLRPLEKEQNKIDEYMRVTGIKTNSKALFAAVEDALVLRRQVLRLRNELDEARSEANECRRLLSDLEESLVPILEKLRQESLF